MFLISNFRHVLNVVCFLLGNFPASEFYIYIYEIRMLGNCPEESIQQRSVYYDRFATNSQFTGTCKIILNVNL